MKRITAAFSAVLLLAGTVCFSAAAEKITVTAEASSVYNEERAASTMTDGNEGTYWHSYYEAEGGNITMQDKPPYYITLELSKADYVSGITYVPRQDNANGRFLEYNIYVSDGDVEEKYLIKSGSFENSAEEQTVDFEVNVKVKKVILEVTKTVASFGTCAELGIIGENKEYLTSESVEKLQDTIAAMRGVAVNTEGFIAVESSRWGDGFKAGNLFDNKNGTIWHSNPDESGNTHTVTVDMGKVHTLRAVDYVPRSNDRSGFFFKFSIAVSTDGKSYSDITQKPFEISESEMDNQKTWHFDFPKLVEARYVKISISSCFLGHAAADEIVFYETKESHENAEKELKEKYVMTVGEKKITVLQNEEESDITLDAAPFIDRGRTMIPLRGLTEAMGAEIAWDNDTRTITVAKDTNVITLQIMNTSVYVYKYFDGEYKTIRYTLDVPPKIVGERTYIPIRFVSEHLGYDVLWNAETMEISVISK